MKNVLLFTITMLLFISFKAECQVIKYNPGDGLHVTSLNKWDLYLSGYIQSIFTYQNVSANNTVQNSFGVHRARIDLAFNYLSRYSMFFEFEAAGQRTEMVLAQVDAKLWGTNEIRAGKFINPFSAENNRSTSRLTTIERYSGLNSIFILPALDSQFGVMFFGSSSKFNYYFSITNGNGNAAQNIPENNNSKDFTGRLDYKVNDNFNFGGSLEFTTEAAQKLDLLDHTFNNFNSVNVKGKRIGYLGNFSYKNNPFLFRGELFQYNFKDDLSNSNQVKAFIGGYLELGYFLFGNEANGLQTIGRFETARYGHTVNQFSGPTILNSYLLGANWLADNIFSFQVNLIYERANKKSTLPAVRLSGKSSELVLLTTLQLRF